jgi:hypothetical protein
MEPMRKASLTQGKEKGKRSKNMKTVYRAFRTQTAQKSLLIAQFQIKHSKYQEVPQLQIKKGIKHSLRSFPSRKDSIKY